MHCGKAQRMKRLFDSRSGNTLIIAADHGGIAGPLPGIGRPGELAATCRRGGANAILTTRGFFRAAVTQWSGSLALILRITGGFTTLGGKFEEQVISSVETALQYGAACAAVTVKFGHELESQFIAQASRLADSCDSWNLPLLIEALPQAEESDVKAYGEAVILAARAAAEIGADMVKVRYPGDPELFARCIAGCPVPVVMLGGPKTANPRELLGDIHSALAAGAKGVAVGRNVWQQGNTEKLLEAVRLLVHEGAGVEEAAKGL